jgi:hypothetical protein
MDARDTHRNTSNAERGDRRQSSVLLSSDSSHRSASSGRDVSEPFSSAAVTQWQTVQHLSATMSLPGVCDEEFSSGHVSSRSLLAADHAREVGHSVASPPSEAGLTTGADRMDVSHSPNTPVASVGESCENADPRDTIEEDDLYRSLADNDLAVVPYGITLERYLALVIFKCAFTRASLLVASLVVSREAVPSFVLLLQAPRYSWEGRVIRCTNAARGTESCACGYRGFAAFIRSQTTVPVHGTGSQGQVTFSVLSQAIYMHLRYAAGMEVVIGT